MVFVNSSCFDFLPTLEKGRYQLAILDLPYGITRNKWDQKLDLQKLWEVINPLIKPNGVILAFGVQPFTSHLVLSRKDFRYTWVWEKTHPTGHLNAKKVPMRAHEDIVVFYNSKPVYNPQMWDCGVRKTVKNKALDITTNYGNQKKVTEVYDTTMRYPRTVQKFASEKQTYNFHPTQKPVSLLRYLIRTYTNEGDFVLDPTAGVASTGVAALQENRFFEGCEINEEYWKIGFSRLENSNKLMKYEI